MRKFIAFYIGTASDEDKAADAAEDHSERDARGMQAWGDWMQRHRDVIVDAGGPLGATLKVSHHGIRPHRNTLAGYVVVRADTHEQAAAYFTDHPHFAIFPGDSVEVVECTEIPGI